MGNAQPPPSKDTTTARAESMIVFELDEFATLGTTLSAATLNRLLDEVPKRCQELLPETVHIRRGEGNAFSLRANLGEAETTVLAERMKVQFISRPFAAEGHMVTLSASFGVAARDHATRTDEELLTRAAGALAEAQARGGNRVEVALREQRNLPVTSNAPDDPQDGRVLMPHDGLKPARTPTPVVAPAEDLPVFDLDTIEQLQQLADDPEFLEELYESYLASAQQSVLDLLNSVDLDTKRKAAHVLKGSSMNVGARAVATACQELEHGLKTQADSVDVTAWVKVIEAELGRVRASWNATFGPK